MSGPIRVYEPVSVPYKRNEDGSIAVYKGCCVGCSTGIVENAIGYFLAQAPPIVPMPACTPLFGLPSAVLSAAAREKHERP